MPISLLVERSRIEYARRNWRHEQDPVVVVREAIEKHGDKLAVSCSFGACSVVVLHMALQLKPDIKVVFNDTGVEYPETYAHRDELKRLWNLNLIETKPIKSFWQCVKEHGFPLIRTAYGGMWKKHRKRNEKPECCIYLKELPMKGACKRHGITACLTGLRAAESGVRMFVIAQRGQVYHTTRFGSLWRCHPIAFWTKRQVEDYLTVNQIPRNQLYLKGIERSGCMPCTSFINWEKQLAKFNPRMYRLVQKMRHVPLIDDYISFEDQLASVCDPKELVQTYEGIAQAVRSVAQQEAVK